MYYARYMMTVCLTYPYTKYSVKDLQGVKFYVMEQTLKFLKPLRIVDYSSMISRRLFSHLATDNGTIYSPRLVTQPFLLMLYLSWD